MNKLFCAFLRVGHPHRRGSDPASVNASEQNLADA